MYIPAAFKIDNWETLAAFMHENSFATVISYADGAPFASHLPILLEDAAGPPGRLLGHMARANPQWRHFAGGAEVLIIFHGPHGYVSPQWYKDQPAVPTWNYAAVHAYGLAQILNDEDAVTSILDRTVRKYEAGRTPAWSGELPSEFAAAKRKAIVAFEVRISRLEGKFKLGQNRSAEDLRGVVAALKQSARGDDQSLADFMKLHLPLGTA
jgi:transcriptional regulator